MRIIFLSGIPITRRLSEKLFLNQFRDAGITTAYCDISHIYWSKKEISDYQGEQDPLSLGFCQAFRLDSHLELLKFLRQEKNNKSVVWMLDFLQFSMILRLLLFRLTAVPFVTLRSSLDEGYTSVTNIFSLLEFALNCLRNWRRLVRAVGTRQCGYLYRMTSILPAPAVVISSGTVGQGICKRLKGQEYCSLPSPLVCWDNSKSEKYLVLIEDAFKARLDSRLGGEKIDGLEKLPSYYRDIHDFMLKLAKDLALQPVIAASGKYLYKDHEFGSIDVRYGETYELVNNAGLVLGHSSNCCFQVLIHKKPFLSPMNTCKIIRRKVLKRKTSHFWQNMAGKWL